VFTLNIDAAFSQRAIYRQTGIPLTTVKRIIMVYQETGEEQFWIGKANMVKKRCSTSSHDRLIVRASSANPQMTAVNDARETGTLSPLRTVQRRLNEGGRFVQKPTKKTSSHFKND